MTERDASPSPSNPVQVLQPPAVTSTKQASSRSQSPAKRLKSEEPPAMEVEGTASVPVPEPTVVPPTVLPEPDPMDEDMQSTSGGVPLVDQTDGAIESCVGASPETAGSVTPASTALTPASTAPTATSGPPASTAATPATTPPLSVEEQVERVWQSKLTSKMVEGDVWYVVSDSWLRRFFAQSPEHAKSMELSKEDAEGEVGPIDNSDIVDTAQLEELARKKSDESTLYPSPHPTPPQPNGLVTAGPVQPEITSGGERADEGAQEKRALTQEAADDDFVPLKPGELGKDFEALPAEVWELLVSCYGLAQNCPVIKRRVFNTAIGGGGENLMLDLYPPLFTVYRLRDPSQQISRESLKGETEQPPEKVVAAKAEGFQKFLKKVKALSGVESGRKIRLWKLRNDISPEIPADAAKGAKRNSRKLKKMVIDVTDFLNLTSTELVDLKDETNNDKYNGHLCLGDTELSTGGDIVVEEQNSEGKWASELATKCITKFGEKVTVAKAGFKGTNGTSKTVSRSASPAKPSFFKKNIMNRGRETRRSGRVQGTCGLSNLGNSCYMNSALQCLRSVKELSQYFLLGEYERELNPDNPLAHHGKVAKTYAQLLQSIFGKDCPSSVAPREFKTTIGRFGPSFSGYQQQDSQEFLAFLLDGLHEDLNRIKRKPYIEKPDSTDDIVGDPVKIAELADRHWDIYKARNDSAVADLFAGLYKSTLVCPQCNKVSITFDPFMDLTLPLPVESYWSREVYFFPRKGRIVKIPVEIPKTATMRDLKEYVAKKMSIPYERIMASEVYKSKFYKHYDEWAIPSDVIQSADFAFFYELDETPTNYPLPSRQPRTRSMLHGFGSNSDDEVEDVDPHESEKLLVPVFSKRHRPTAYAPHAEEIFGQPFFIVVNREEAQDIEAIVEKVVEKYQVLTTRDLYEDTGLAEPEENAPKINGTTEDDEGSIENVKAEDASMTTADEEMDGFVDVSMKDAESLDSEAVNKPPPVPAQGRRKVPKQVADLFSLKVQLKKADSDRVPTGWQTGLEAIDMVSRLIREIPAAAPAPEIRRQAPVQERASALFGNLNHRLSGRASPASNASEPSEDDDQSFQDAQDAQETDEDLMHASSDEEENGVARSSGNPEISFNAINATNFYGQESNSSSMQRFKTPSRGPSPRPDSPVLIRWGESIMVEWSQEGYDAVFGGTSADDLRGMEQWSSPMTIADPELEMRRVRRRNKQKDGIHLEDCLDEFAKEEVLSEGDAWYCPSCKEHRRASKKFELWKCPDILIIHLKRFSSARRFSDKIDDLIQCPIDELDLTDRVGLKEEGKSLQYELFAVDNHFGGLGGGHYTAAVKNWVDGKWYYCDDASVHEMREHSVVTKSAYLLFYRRKHTSGPLGGPEFERIITPEAEQRLVPSEEDEEESSPSSREASPRPISNGTTSTNGTATGFRPAPVGNNTLWGSSANENETRGSSQDTELPDYDSLQPSDALPDYDTSVNGVIHVNPLAVGPFIGPTLPNGDAVDDEDLVVEDAEEAPLVPLTELPAEPIAEASSSEQDVSVPVELAADEDRVDEIKLGPTEQLYPTGSSE